MKRTFTTAGAFALTALLMSAGCSATRTQKTAGETIDDGVITARVKVALIDNPTTKARQINVDTHQGVVQLQGFVDTNEEKMAATDVARSVSGGQSVRNDLEVKHSPK